MKAWQEGQVSTRFSDDIDLYLYVSEKEAILAFPSHKGGFDYLGFYSTNPFMLGYCRDFFDYFFEKGVPLTQERGDRIHELRKRYYREREKVKTR